MLCSFIAQFTHVELWTYWDGKSLAARIILIFNPCRISSEKLAVNIL